MAANYPYVSAQGALVKAFDQFRKTFPPTLDADALKKFSIAPANESYVVNTFRFLELIDDDGKRIDSATEFFYGDDGTFSSGLDAVVSAAYQALIADHGQAAWEQSKETLTSWFRVTDKTSELVGGRQAQTFLTLAALAGHGELRRPSAKPNSGSSAKREPSARKVAAGKRPDTKVRPNVEASQAPPAADSLSGAVGLTVRIEVNLPANGTPDAYDAIFASLRKHLIDRAEP